MKKFTLGIALCAMCGAAAVFAAGAAGSSVRLCKRYFGEKNYEKAVAYCQAAAERDDAFSQYTMGVMYSAGLGVPMDAGQADAYFSNAAAQDYPQAQLALAHASERAGHAARAVEWYRRAAKGGNSDALFALGLKYCNGDGVEQDRTECEKLLKKAAARGNSAAADLFAVMRFKRTKAADWLKTAYSSGTAYTQYLVGEMYYSGDGVKKNAAQAAKWFRKAAGKGEARAQCGLGTLYFSGEGVVKNYAEAVRWFEKAARQGDTAAQLSLARMYLRGAGVRRSGMHAYKWAMLAAALGSDEAADLALDLRETLNGDQLDEADFAGKELLADILERKRNRGDEARHKETRAAVPEREADADYFVE